MQLPLLANLCGLLVNLCRGPRSLYYRADYSTTARSTTSLSRNFHFRDAVMWSKNSAPARIANLWQKVSLWHVEWGPIHHWPQLFENGFGDVKEQGRSGQWAEEIQLVVENGQELLKEIQPIVDGMLPTKDWMMQDVW